MKGILIKSCFECPFCTAGVMTKDGMFDNMYKCRQLNEIVTNERTSIDSRCPLRDIDEDKLNQLDILKQAYLDIEDDLTYSTDNDVEGKEKEKIIYEFLEQFFE